MNDNVDTLARLMAAKALAGGGGGGGGTTELYWATYNVTTFDEILAAVEAGKLPCVKEGSNIFVCGYAGKSGTQGWIEFASIDYLPNHTGILVSYNDGMTAWEKTTESQLIAARLFTAKGDIVAGTSSNHVARLGKGNTGELLGTGGTGNTGLRWTKNLPILTTAPSSNNTAGGLIFVVLDSEPATYYDGYYYIITEAS